MARRPRIFEKKIILDYFKTVLHREGAVNGNLSGMRLVIPILMCAEGPQRILEIVRKWKEDHPRLLDEKDLFEQIIKDAVAFMKSELDDYIDRKMKGGPGRPDEDDL